MKNKIVKHLAGNVRHELQEARGEAVNLRDKYPDALGNTLDGIGLDFQVLREKLDEALKLIELLV